MVKLGQTTTGAGKGVKYLWLVKDMGIYEKYSKTQCYVVMGFKPEYKGWCTLYNGTLKQCRAYIGDEMIVNI